MTKAKPYDSRDSDHAIVHLGLNVSSSAHNCGCVVDGGNAMCSDLSIIIINIYVNQIPGQSTCMKSFIFASSLCALKTTCINNITA